MNIHPLWWVCLLVRICLVAVIFYVSTNFSINYKKYILFIPLIIGLGFAYKAFTGSNNEYQIQKVFWHETRMIHSIFYLFATFCFYSEKQILGAIILSLDVIFSILYRLLNLR